jgi:hypothetical protein
MMAEDDRTSEEIASRRPGWIDHHPDPRDPGLPPPAWLPASLTFVLAMLAFGGCQVYALMTSQWKWSIAGLVLLAIFTIIGSILQSYANRKSK